MTASEAEHIVGSKYDLDRRHYEFARHHKGGAPRRTDALYSYGREAWHGVLTIIVCSLAWALIANLAAIYSAWCSFFGTN